MRRAKATLRGQPGVLSIEAGRARQLLAEMETILAELDSQSARWVAENIPRDYLDGLHAADERLSSFGLEVGRMDPRFHREAIQALVDDAQSVLEDATHRIGRNGERLFRKLQVDRTIDRAITKQLGLGVIEGKARVEVSNAIRDRLIDTFGDAPFRVGGRTFSADGYAELVARTKTREAQTRGLIARMAEDGQDLVQVSSHGATDGCRFYEGRVFSISGTSEKYESLSSIGGGPPFHPNSHVAGTVIDGCRIRAISSREFRGQVVIIKTASGEETTITANHPVATDQAFIPAKRLKVGDRIVRSLCRGRVSFAANHEHGPTEVVKLLELCDQSREFITAEIKVRAEDFHGEGVEGQVAIVRMHREFLDEKVSSRAEPLEEDAVVGAPGLTGAGESRATLGFDRLHDGESMGRSLRRPTRAHGEQSGMSAESSLIGRFPRKEYHRGVSSTAQDDAASIEQAMDGPPTDTEFLRDLGWTYPGLIQLDRVISVRTREFSGHVYCLQSASGVYSADGIIVHNCEHVLEPFVEELASDSALERAQRPVPEGALNRPFAEVNKLAA